MIIDIKRNVSAGMPVIFTIDARKRVKKVKLAIKPMTTPSGRFLPDESAEEERIIGNIGRIQGESIVTIPARNAKIISKSID